MAASYLYASRGEFHADGWLGFQIKFIASKTRQKITFADPGISDQHNCWSEMTSVKKMFWFFLRLGESSLTFK